MAHLAFAGSDLVCATHGGHTAFQQTQSPMPDMHHHGDTGDTGQERCKVPARSDCCEAMTTCSANAALTSTIDDQAGPSREARLAVFIADAPLTRILPPEPPPPKAQA